ncbi:hypothetical protein DL96DRAFT_1619809 [Flagelloscypha sp. PMI_526]|nr:hypothetical protein DL96DRAFT_1619809 [Flagelloscypha sp. PMI_526]
MPPKKDAAKSAKSKKDAAASASYEISDLVLGKVKGFPAWPARVINPSTAPTKVKQDKPKNVKTTIYCLFFFGSNDHAWLSAKDMSPLGHVEIDAFLTSTSKKTAGLKEAYEIAKDPEAYQKALEDADAVADEDEDMEEVDQLDEDDNKGKPKKKAAPAANKKRKRDAEPAKKVPAKKGAAKPTSKKGKGGKNKKSKETVESEDDAEAEADEDVPPVTKKAKKDDSNDDPEILKVKDWRHRLQKGFLTAKPPTDDALPGLDELLKTVEDYDAITLEQLSSTKIGKVMRHIAALADDKIPKDSEYNFRKRANDLVSRWSKVVGGNQPNGVNGESAEPLTAIA